MDFHRRLQWQLESVSIQECLFQIHTIATVLLPIMAPPGYQAKPPILISIMQEVDLLIFKIYSIAFWHRGSRIGILVPNGSYNSLQFDSMEQ